MTTPSASRSLSLALLSALCIRVPAAAQPALEKALSEAASSVLGKLGGMLKGKR